MKLYKIINMKLISWSAQKFPLKKKIVNTNHFSHAEKQTGSIEQGSENAEHEGGSSPAVAPFCFEEALVQCK